MSDQVFRYNNEEDYRNPYKSGVAVSKKFDTLKEAERFQALMRKGDPTSCYYGISHLTQCMVINFKEGV